jgi:hypothetical protein
MNDDGGDGNDDDVVVKILCLHRDNVLEQMASKIYKEEAHTLVRVALRRCLC